MKGLLRFVDASRGPVVGVQSSLMPSLWRPLGWYSRAKLGPRFDSSFGGKHPVSVWGEAWHTDKETSQIESVRHALERASFDQWERGEGSCRGLAVDFAKDRTEFSVRASHRALKSWASEMIGKDAIAFIPTPLPRFAHRLFRKHTGDLVLFESALSQSQLSLAVLQLPSEGILVALGIHGGREEACQAAFIELFLRRAWFERIRRGQEQLLDRLEQQQIWNFATDPSLAREYLRRLLRPRHSLEVTMPVLLRNSLEQSTVFEGIWVCKVEIASPSKASDPCLDRLELKAL